MEALINILNCFFCIFLISNIIMIFTTDNRFRSLLYSFLSFLSVFILVSLFENEILTLFSIIVNLGVILLVFLAFSILIFELYSRIKKPLSDWEARNILEIFWFYKLIQTVYFFFLAISLTLHIGILVFNIFIYVIPFLLEVFSLNFQVMKTLCMEGGPRVVEPNHPLFQLAVRDLVLSKLNLIDLYNVNYEHTLYRIRHVLQLSVILVENRCLDLLPESSNYGSPLEGLTTQEILDRLNRSSNDLRSCLINLPRGEYAKIMTDISTQHVASVNLFDKGLGELNELSICNEQVHRWSLDDGIRYQSLQTDIESKNRELIALQETSNTCFNRLILNFNDLESGNASLESMNQIQGSNTGNLEQLGQGPDTGSLEQINQIQAWEGSRTDPFRNPNKQVKLELDFLKSWLRFVEEKYRNYFYNLSQNIDLNIPQNRYEITKESDITQVMESLRFYFGLFNSMDQTEPLREMSILNTHIALDLSIWKDHIETLTRENNLWLEVCERYRNVQLVDPQEERERNSAIAEGEQISMNCFNFLRDINPLMENTMNNSVSRIVPIGENEQTSDVIDELATHLEFRQFGVDIEGEDVGTVFVGDTYTEAAARMTREGVPLEFSETGQFGRYDNQNRFTSNDSQGNLLKFPWD